MGFFDFLKTEERKREKLGEEETEEETEMEEDEQEYRVDIFVTDGDGYTKEGLTKDEAKKVVNTVKECIEKNQGYVEFEEEVEGEYEYDLLLLNKVSQVVIRVN